MICWLKIHRITRYVRCTYLRYDWLHFSNAHIVYNTSELRKSFEAETLGFLILQSLPEPPTISWMGFTQSGNHEASRCEVKGGQAKCK